MLYLLYKVYKRKPKFGIVIVTDFNYIMFFFHIELYINLYLPCFFVFKVDFDDSTSQNRFVVKPGVDENLDESTRQAVHHCRVFVQNGCS
jgi:hypothetical protein